MGSYSKEQILILLSSLFTIADQVGNFKIFIHPTGKYAYFGVINNHYFMRSDYDEIKKEFITPYNFVGGYNSQVIGMM